MKKNYNKNQMKILNFLIKMFKMFKKNYKFQIRIQKIVRQKQFFYNLKIKCNYKKSKI